ncbi:MAG: serine protease, partial [Bacteroidaceae bacterium]|nr:serine protease [Bacteroidaceae bacterium]
GAYHISDSVGKVVDVYLTIPALRSGNGKVQISFNGSVQEIIALTDDDSPIRSGAKVRVLEVIDGSSVLVARL